MKLLASALLMLGLTAPATAQWSYIGQTMCYTVGGVSQCESVGTVFNYALNRTDFISTFSTFYRPFVAQPPAQSNPTYQAQHGDDSQYAAGYAIGSAVGGLLNRWVEHSRRVQQERVDLQVQYWKYLDAYDELASELIRQCESSEASYKRLATNKPNLTFDQARTLTHLATDSHEACDKQRILKKQHYEAGEVIAKAKDRKFLREQIEAIKGQYEKLYDVAAEGYVYTELMNGLAGYYEYQNANEVRK